MPRSLKVAILYEIN